MVSRIAELKSIRLRKKLWKPYRSCAYRSNDAILVLAEPLTFMNRSGTVIPELLGKYNLSIVNLLVICDTLDLPAGSARIKRKGSSAGHRGLQSIIEHVGSGSFLRLYIGVGRPESKTDVIDFVLARPSEIEESRIRQSVENAAEAIIALENRELDSVIESFNTANHA